MKAEDFELELLLHAEMGENRLQYVIDDMNRMGLIFDGIKDVQEFLSLYTI